MKIIECPRDAMQGIHHFIDTKIKIEYINLLLQVGFDSLDFGSFVSPKSIPQLKDTVAVLQGLHLSHTKTKLLAIIANLRGATEAAAFDEISYLGFPFSISETFQLRNTNSSIAESYERLKPVQEICKKNNKTLVVYLSMGFGNPYRDSWSLDLLTYWFDQLSQLDVQIISLSDTIGVAQSADIQSVFTELIPKYPHIEIGAHLHSTAFNWREKIEAAFSSGCRRIDGAIKGFGGCPMAMDELTGNMATENIIALLHEKNIPLDLDLEKFEESCQFALHQVFKTAP